MAHCGSEEAALALAQIDEADAEDDLDTARIATCVAEQDLELCDQEHGP